MASATQSEVRRRKAAGVYYTPPTVVRYIVQQTLEPLVPAAGRRRPLRVLDPACGDGAFLVEVFRYLLSRQRPALSPRGEMPSKAAVDRRVRLIRQHVFGVDLDAQAVAAARRRLAHLALGLEDGAPPAMRQLPAVERLADRFAANVRQGDALVGPEFLGSDPGRAPLPPEARESTFAWSRDFAPVFAGNRGGFDAIVGNPPYINIRLLTQARGEAIKRYFRGRYQCAYRGYDVFVLFLEKAFELLRPGGACGMIVPNKLASLDYALPCRSLLLEQTTLRQITDVADLKIFPDAGVYPYIVIWQKQLADVDHCVAVSRPRTPRDLAAPRKPATVRQKSLSAAAGFHLHGRLDVEARVATRPLGQCCSLHSGTSGFVAQRLAGDLLEHDQAGDRPCFEFVVSGNIDRYRVRTGRVRYMKRSYARPVLPIGCEQLSARKARLFREPKIVIAGMTRRLEAALDPGGLALGVQVYAAADPQEDPRFLLGLLNSKLLSYLFRIRFQAKRLSGGYLAINKGQLTRLPIRLVVEGESRELAWREAVIGAVQRMAELQAAGDAGDDAATHEKRVAEFHRVDRQLDRLVYQLYAVSDDEAAVIEQEIEA